MLLGRDVAEHRGAVPADHRRADGAGNVVVAGRDVGGQRAERVERRLAALLQLPVHVFLDELHGHMARAFDHGLHVVLPGDLREFAQGVELGELRFVVGIGNTARTQAVTQRERHVVGLHDVADILEVFVQKALLVMREAPLGHDRAAARDDAGDTFGAQRNEGQTHPGVDGEVVHALLGLLDQGVAKQLPGEVFGHAAHLLQRLINGHGADGHGRVAQNPLTGLVNVFSRAQIHHRVGAPADGPDHFFHLFGNARRGGRVADIGVDFHQEVAADDHRFALRVVDVVGDDGTAARHFIAHEFRRDARLDVRAKMLAGVLLQPSGIEHFFLPLILPDSDELHLGRNQPLTRVVHLADVGAGLGTSRQR